MRVVVNGEDRSIPGGATIIVLLHSLGLEPKRIAVEVNGRIVPSREHGEVALKECDRIEIVQFVGGG
ncbi:MAG: sulfur carrier protein ThiS [Acidobacteria bacterium]|nr:sulfur carrier protein ThiS [Acidobacteriota bacterium]